jgi:cell division protein FtsI (penicillin-binding protein 3)
VSRTARGPWNTPERRRLRWWILVVSLLLAAGMVVGQAARLQAWEGERWARVAEEQQRSRVPLPARRGAIYDRDGLPLALTHETFAVAVAPGELRDPRAAAERIVTVLGLSRADARRATDRERRWVVLPGRFSAEQRKRMGDVRGIHFERRLDRFYPQGDVGREVTGSVSADGRTLGGIEQQFDGLLRGTAGYSVLRREASGVGRPAISLPVAPPADGADVHLTLDFRLQEIADGALAEAIRAQGASGGDLLLADPRTGEILAAVSRRGGVTRSLAAITEPYEPGSTLKPLLIAALLAEGRARLSDSFDAERGVWQVGRRTIRDVKPYDRLTLHDALRVSSNIAIVKAAARLRPEEQYRYLRDFGFGTFSGVEYPAESAGRLRRPAQWSSLSPASLAMGYEIAVTPLQLLMAYGALANGGVLYEPRLLREVRAPDGTTLARSEVQPLRRVVPEHVARAVTEVLVEAVSDGTATRAALSTFDVAGKTGTARRTGQGGGYASGSYTASFVGYFPASDPQLVIYVKLDEPRNAIYGGLAAAPVTREMLQGILAAHTRALDGASLLVARGGAVVPERSRGLPLADGAGGQPEAVVLDMPVPETAPPTRDQTRVPAVAGLSLRDAARHAHGAGLRVKLRGSGLVARTEPAAGTLVSVGDTLLLVGGGGSR